MFDDENSTSTNCFSTNFSDQNLLLCICLVATLTHSLFWFQVVFFVELRQRSMQWIYAYLIVDEILLGQFFFVYAVRSKFDPCRMTKIWISIVCFVDGILDNYVNTLQSYILFALNICRYVQICFNQNVYVKNGRLLIFGHFCIYLTPLIIFILQYAFKWAFFVDSCDIHYIHKIVKILNIIFAFVLPIVLNFFVISISFVRIQNLTRLKSHRHYKNAREKYSRSLIVQFTFFYTIWISFWSPNIVIYQLSTVERRIRFGVEILNYIGVVFDPLIVASLDIRFWRTWRKHFLQKRVKPQTLPMPMEKM